MCNIHGSSSITLCRTNSIVTESILVFPAGVRGVKTAFLRSFLQRVMKTKYTPLAVRNDRIS
jgi:hypothetical protein